MIDEFKNLREDEIQLLLDAPVLVTILIAGADDEIDKAEITEGVKIADAKQERAREQLIAYYKIVAQDFKGKLEEKIKTLPESAEERTDAIAKELRKLNRILPKVDHNFALKLYASLKDIAKKIAEASGGILGYLSISYEESQLIGLEMVQDPSEY